ncbi:phasin family protein [Methylobacterium sp. J-090]|uniref:phasin family protein n=1 Tax=Methylobacterium sp. J-090 TaxID=2836666 RepID=UPI001FB9703C|nr:phasin family protein [Methylobacterium sp. J-090]MCJ2080324.1 phasin family protein [Methylobacterium sp. J-090]
MNAQTNGSRARHGGHPDGIPDAVKAAADKAIWPMPNGLDAAASQAREATVLFSQTLEFSGEEGERLAMQSRRNMEAVRQCRLVLMQAFQAASEDWMEMVQAQWKRNFDGLERLMQATSVHEFGTIQGELVRENLEHILKDSRSIAERSMRAADEAGKALAAMADRTTDVPA